MTSSTGRRPLPPAFVTLDLCEDATKLLVDFLNTIDYDEGTDALASLDGWRAWLTTHDLADGFAEQHDADLLAARDLRADLRALAAGQECAQVRRVGIQVALGAEGDVQLSADSPTGLLAAAVAKMTIEQRLNRLKICPADDCRWAFYDQSRNTSRQWCSMKVCGNRAKARTHRERAGQP